MIKITESQLKEVVTRVNEQIKNSAKEGNLIRLIEERGMFKNYEHLIQPIIRHVENIIKNYPPTVVHNMTLYGKQVNTNVYLIVLPNNFFKEITWIKNLKVTITVFDLIENDLDTIFLDKIKSFRDSTYEIKDVDYLSSDGKLETVEIKIVSYSLNKVLYKENIQASLYHEFTHAFENYNRLKKFGRNIYDHLKTTNYTKNVNHDNDYFKYINYYLLNKVELNANIAAVYGDLERIDSKRVNFKNDIKEISAYKIYNLIKFDYLPTLIKSSVEQWEIYRDSSYLNNRPTDSIEKFKRDFIKSVDFNLNELFVGIGKVASKYYDDQDFGPTMKENRENNTIILKDHDIEHLIRKLIAQ